MVIKDYLYHLFFFHIKQRVSSLKSTTAVINNEKYLVRNFDSKGCFIETHVPYPPGTTINMELDINDGIPVVAEVKHNSERGISVEFKMDRKKKKEFKCISETIK